MWFVASSLPSSPLGRVTVRDRRTFTLSGFAAARAGWGYIPARMLDSLLVTFREGLESFLIIGIITAYLRKTNRARLIRGVHIGLGASVVTCLAGAWLWMQVPNQPFYEGVFALGA